MKIINCTPHLVTIVDEDGDTIRSFAPSVTCARVVVDTKEEGDLEGLLLFSSQVGSVCDLPAYEEGTFLIVSRMVQDACPNRGDLLVPSQRVKDETGCVLGCKGFEITQTAKRNLVFERWKAKLNKLGFFNVKLSTDGICVYINADHKRGSAYTFPNGDPGFDRNENCTEEKEEVLEDLLRNITRKIERDIARL